MEISAAVVRERSGVFTLEKLELEEPREDEILVRIAGVGICQTDLSARAQHIPVRLPGVFGHEGSGVVEKVGARVTKVQAGDHVVLTFWSCGRCPQCQQGEDSYCLHFLQNFMCARTDGSSPLRKGEEVIHGLFFKQSSFASHALVTERNVVKIDKDVPLELVGPLGCSVISGVGAVMNSLGVRPGSSIAIFGVGSVGMSAVLGAVACGCTTVIAVTRKASRLEMARELGATHLVNPTEVDPVQTIMEITGHGVDYSLECAGHPVVFRQAVDALNRRGVCALVGAAPRGTEVHLNMTNIMQGRTVRGSVEGDAVPDIFIPKMIDLYKQGRLPFDRLIKFYALDEINQAVEDMQKGLTLKPVLKP